MLHAGLEAFPGRRAVMLSYTAQGRLFYLLVLELEKNQPLGERVSYESKTEKNNLQMVSLWRTMIHQGCHDFPLKSIGQKRRGEGRLIHRKEHENLGASCQPQRTRSQGWPGWHYDQCRVMGM